MSSLRVAVWAIIMTIMVLLPTGECFPLVWKAGVGVKNEMKGTADVSLHCQSHETNFTPMTLQNNQVFKWRFEPSAGSFTYYWCDFGWNGSTASFPVWSIDVAPVYDFSICDWKIDETGFSLYNPPKEAWEHKHEWGDHE